ATRKSIIVNTDLVSSHLGLNAIDRQMKQLSLNLATDKKELIKKQNDADFAMISSVGLVRNNILKKIQDGEYTAEELQEDFDTLSSLVQASQGRYGDNLFAPMNRAMGEIATIDREISALEGQANTPDNRTNLRNLRHERNMAINRITTRFGAVNQQVITNLNNSLGYMRYQSILKEQLDTLTEGSPQYKVVEEMMKVTPDEYGVTGGGGGGGFATGGRRTRGSKLWDGNGSATAAGINMVQKRSWVGDKWNPPQIVEGQEVSGHFTKYTAPEVISRMSTMNQKFSVENDAIAAHLVGELVTSMNRDSQGEIGRAIASEVYENIGPENFREVEATHKNASKRPLTDDERRMIPLHSLINSLVDNVELSFLTSSKGKNFMQGLVGHIATDLNLDVKDDITRASIQGLFKTARSINENALSNMGNRLRKNGEMPQYLGQDIIDAGGNINGDFKYAFDEFQSGNDMRELDDLWSAPEGLRDVFVKLDHTSLQNMKRYFAWESLRPMSPGSQATEGIPTNLSFALDDYGITLKMLEGKSYGRGGDPFVRRKEDLTKLWIDYDQDNLSTVDKNRIGKSIVGHYKDNVFDIYNKQITKLIGTGEQDAGKNIVDLVPDDDTDAFQEAAQVLVDQESDLLRRLGQLGADAIANSRKQNKTGLVHDSKWYLPKNSKTGYEMYKEGNTWVNRNKVNLQYRDENSAIREIPFGIGELDMNTWGYRYGK
ncbi:MAG: hypothetical protein CL489_14745, partial [Acidobacteria bacterium]|nr:hypothetical protein [Acidobacteriota bacterium]